MTCRMNHQRCLDDAVSHGDCHKTFGIDRAWIYLGAGVVILIGCSCFYAGCLVCGKRSEHNRSRRKTYELGAARTSDGGVHIHNHVMSPSNKNRQHVEMVQSRGRMEPHGRMGLRSLREGG